MKDDSSPKFDPTKIWESQSLEHDHTLTVCAFSPCGKYVVAGSRHEDVQRWELASGTRTPLIGHRSWVMALFAHPITRHYLHRFDIQVESILLNDHDC